jgi:hypothetical protein
VLDVVVCGVDVVVDAADAVELVAREVVVVIVVVVVVVVEGVSAAQITSCSKSPRTVSSASCATDAMSTTKLNAAPISDIAGTLGVLT